MPVSRKQPAGKLLLRYRYSTSDTGSRFMLASVVVAANSLFVPAHDLQADLRGRRQWFRRNQYAGAQGAASVVHLGLGQIQRVFSFDTARAHVIANGVADDFPFRGYEKGQLGLGHRPGRVVANGNSSVGADDAMRRCLEEEFRALGVVNPIVKVAASGRFRFLDARFPAAIVGDSGCPHFLVSDGSSQVLECGACSFNPISILDLALEVAMQIVSSSQ